MSAKTYFGDGLSVASLKLLEQDLDRRVSTAQQKVLGAITHPVEIDKIYKAKGEHDALKELQKLTRDAITEKEKETRGPLI